MIFFKNIKKEFCEDRLSVNHLFPLFTYSKYRKSNQCSALNEQVILPKVILNTLGLQLFSFYEKEFLFDIKYGMNKFEKLILNETETVRSN